MTYKIYFGGGAQAALVIVADTGLVANASRCVSGRVVQYERIARPQATPIFILLIKKKSNNQ